ncbi:unnamed protein product [Closterium sp. Naga37s-1]|nr:unnamed protein product [Closterium sp. Naga37s-1]
MADHPDAIERPDDPGDEPARRSPIDLSAAVTGLDLLFSNLAAVDNHGKAPAVAPTVDVPFEPIDEPLCPSPTAPVLEQDSSNPSGEEIAAVPVAKKSASRKRTCGSCAVLASELPRGEEDRWVLCGAGQRAPQGDRWVLCGAGQRAPQGGGGPVGPVRCWPAISPGGRRPGGSFAVLASELPRGEEDRWVLCGAGQRAHQGGGGPVGPVRCWPASSPGGRRTGGSCAVLASELPKGEGDRWVLCGAGQRAPQGGGGPVGPVRCWPASSPGGRRTGGSLSGS